jgi:hypothetical protein
MLLYAGGGEGPFHQAFLANAQRIAELRAALTKLRLERDVAAIDAFFSQHEAVHREAERAVPLEVSDRKWHARYLEVEDFLASRIHRAAKLREQNGHVVVRKLGWVQLDRELGRARALRRIGAPASVVHGQRDRVRAAFLATGWDERHAPHAPPLPDLEQWSLPVSSVRHADGTTELQIGDLDSQHAEQQAWRGAQELVERGLELCIAPLAEAAGLGGHASLDADGETLIDTGAPAHPGWIEPSWRPCFRVGSAALGIDSGVTPRSGSDPEDVARVRARLAAAAVSAAASGSALVWWLDPSP